MTIGVAQERPGFVTRGESRRAAAPAARAHRGRLFGARVGQLVATQFAVAVVLAGLTQGALWSVIAAAVAIPVLLVTWLPVRRRWAYQWIGTVLRYTGRRHQLVQGETDLLELVAPGARVEQAELAGEPAAMLVDADGLTAVLEVGDPSGLLVEPSPDLPELETLLPGGPDTPTVRLQLLLTGAPGPALRAGGGTPANSYRQLTEGRLLGHARSLLAVRVLRTEGWSEADLERSLSSLVRKLPRKLGGVAVRPLGETAARRVIDELAHHVAGSAAGETWPGLQVGGLAQATFRLGRWPDLRVETSRRLVNRMLNLPATATTVALTVGPRMGTGVAAELTVRLAAPDERTLSMADQSLRRLVAAERATIYRLDGDQLTGLASTLPLALPVESAPPGMPTEEVQPAGLLAGLELSPAAGGLMLGNNRHGAPVVTRLFRPEQTRAVLIGGVRAAQLVALRAMALGARVVVQTNRPRAWEPFVRGAAVPGEAIAVVPPGRVLEIPLGTVLHPLLVVVDVGPVGADNRPGNGWQATLVVRDDFSPVDVDVASRADLLLLQPLRQDEADIAGPALGLGEAAQWLTRIRPDMIGVVNRRAVRWVALSTTPIEQQLIGPLLRG